MTVQLVARPHCPFCAAPWSDAMLAQLDAVSSATSCACCGGDAAVPLPIPTADLCCTLCGRAIYRMASHAHA